MGRSFSLIEEVTDTLLAKGTDEIDADQVWASATDIKNAAKFAELQVRNHNDYQTIVSEGKLKLTVEEFCVRDMAQNVLEMVEWLAQSKSIVTILKIDDVLIDTFEIIRSDQDRIKQTMVNLLTLAIRDAEVNTLISMELSLQFRNSASTSPP